MDMCMCIIQIYFELNLKLDVELNIYKNNKS